MKSRAPKIDFKAIDWKSTLPNAKSQVPEMSLVKTRNQKFQKPEIFLEFLVFMKLKVEVFFQT